MMNDDQLNARAEAMLPAIEHALRTSGRAAATEVLATHLRSFRGAVAKAVQDDNTALIAEVNKHVDWVEGAAYMELAKVEAFDRIAELLDIEVEGDMVEAVQRL